MSWLGDSPWTILTIGLLVEVGLLIWLLLTGRGAALVIMGSVGVLTCVLIVVERIVVTSREQVEATLDDLASTLEKNDINAVVEFISPSATELRQKAQQGLPHVKIEDAHVTDLTITVDQKTQPITAMAVFIGNFSFKMVRGSSPYEKMIRRFHVRFEKQPDRWRIISEQDNEVGRQ